jgi:pyrroline-5-carboxylate reductase
MTDKISAALIGAGAMGGALLRGWLLAGVVDPHRSAVFEPAADEALAALCARCGLGLNPRLDQIRVDALVIAVKPQFAAAALPPYAAIARTGLVVSVMAGSSIALIRRHLGEAPRIVRAMPNLASSIGMGVAGLHAPPGTPKHDRDTAERLMSAVGETVWMDGERELDFVTAVSGSGPAYFFLLTEALAEAGAALGLDPEAALKLARATASGAGALMTRERGPADLRRAVTSPGGTTEAALAVLDGDDQALRQLLKSAVSAAAARAAELTDRG